MEKEESTPTNRSNSCGKLILRALFSHVGLFFLVCLYCALGAWLFVYIEYEDESQRFSERKLRSKDANDSLEYLASLFYYWSKKNFTAAEYTSKAYTELKKYDDYVVGLATDYHYDGTHNEEEWDREWSMGNGILYCVTILTTIGYGHITPHTQLGKVSTILYSMVGIPLTLVFLANIGDLMASMFRYSYSRMCCRWCRSQRRRSEYTRDMVLAMGGRLPPLNKDVVGEEEYMPTESLIVPIILNLLLISMFTLMGAIIFSFGEDWDLLSSGYFTFITLTTIGFGDYYPGKAFKGYKGSVTRTLALMGTCFYMMMGMALVSMCINLMQQQLISKVQWFGKEIGLIKEPDIEDTKDIEQPPPTDVQPTLQPVALQPPALQLPALPPIGQPAV